MGQRESELLSLVMFVPRNRRALTWQEGKEDVDSIYLSDSRLDFEKLTKAFVNKSNLLSALRIVCNVVFMANILFYEIYMSAPYCAKSK